MKTIDLEFGRSLLNAKNYREFMAMFFLKSDRPNQRRLSYAEFSRRAGFASRAFARDVILGERRINLGNFEKICAGLRLNTILREYFRALVSIEEPDFNISSRIDVNENLKRQRAKAEKYLNIKKIEGLSPQRELAQLLLSPDIPTVFAASGTVERGSTLNEIIHRTRLSSAFIEKAMIDLSSVDLIQFKGGRYYPCSASVAVERLGGDSFFKDDFRRTLTRLIRKFEENQQRDTSLFLSSTICVNSSNIPHLRQELNRILTDFIVSAESGDGEILVDLTVGLVRTLDEQTPNRVAPNKF